MAAAIAKEVKTQVISLFELSDEELDWQVLFAVESLDRNLDGVQDWSFHLHRVCAEQVRRKREDEQDRA